MKMKTCQSWKHGSRRHAVVGMVKKNWSVRKMSFSFDGWGDEWDYTSTTCNTLTNVVLLTLLPTRA